MTAPARAASALSSQIEAPPVSNAHAFLKLLNDGKWWITPLASLVSLLLLSKYLWAIGHPELILSSISSPSNLLIWLVFAVLGFLMIIMVLSVPSLVFMLCVDLAKPSRKLEAAVALRFAWVVIGGFVLMTVNLVLSVFDNSLPPWLMFGIITAASAIAADYLLNRRPALKALGQKLVPQTSAHGIRRVIGWSYKAWLGAMLAFTAVCGIFPAQFTLLAWRGAEEGIEVGGLIVICFFSMILYLIPILVFFRLKGPLLARAGKATFILIIGIFLHALWMPAMLSIWVYSAANMLKLRDHRPLDYVLDAKDYPPTLFDQNVWKLKYIDKESGLYSIYAFRQYRFGDVLLLCPGRYARTSLKDIETYAPQCVAIADAKVKIATLSNPPKFPVLGQIQCRLWSTPPTKPPLLTQPAGRCLYSEVF